MNRIIGAATLLAATLLPAGARELDREEQEKFLKTAKIVTEKTLSTGVTASSKATLQEADFTHSAHLQTIEEFRVRFEGDHGVEMNFRDSYKFNIAAYELAKLLRLNMVPASVPRRVNGIPAAVTWWVDDARMTERERRKQKLHPPDARAWNQQLAIVKVFDELIFNTDRNLGNLVITKDWQIHMIDHTRAFRILQFCPNLKKLNQIDRKLLEELRALRFETLHQKVGAYLTDGEIRSLLARRDRIVKEFDSRVQRQGAAAVLFDLKPVPGGQAQAVPLSLRDVDVKTAN